MEAVLCGSIEPGIAASATKSSKRSAVFMLVSWRVNKKGNGLTAEKGYTREAGNLVFHASLILLTIALAFGALFSYRGTVIVKEGNGFANTLTQYDDFRAGKLFNIKSMPNFYFTLNDFTVDFEDDKLVEVKYEEPSADLLKDASKISGA